MIQQKILDEVAYLFVEQFDNLYGMLVDRTDVKRIRQSADQYLPNILELLTNCLILGQDIFIYRFGSFTTVMALILIFKCTSTLGALPHHVYSFTRKTAPPKIQKISATISEIATRAASPLIDILPPSRFSQYRYPPRFEA